MPRVAFARLNFFFARAMFPWNLDGQPKRLLGGGAVRGDGSDGENAGTSHAR